MNNLSRNVIGLIMFLSIPASAVSDDSKLAVEIVSPDDGGKVGHRPFIEGLVSKPSAEVWVVIHPLAVSQYWVQPRVTVRPDSGKWKVKVYVGDPSSKGLFEIRAVANPKIKLKEGMKLENWPETSAISNVVEVQRK